MGSPVGARRKLVAARAILRGNDSDRSDRDILKALWQLLLPDECGRDGTQEAERV